MSGEYELLKYIQNEAKDREVSLTFSDSYNLFTINGHIKTLTTIYVVVEGAGGITAIPLNGSIMAATISRVQKPESPQ